MSEEEVLPQDTKVIDLEGESEGTGSSEIEACPYCGYEGQWPDLRRFLSHWKLSLEEMIQLLGREQANLRACLNVTRPDMKGKRLF